MKCPGFALGGGGGILAAGIDLHITPLYFPDCGPETRLNPGIYEGGGGLNPIPPVGGRGLLMPTPN